MCLIRRVIVTVQVFMVAMITLNGQTNIRFKNYQSEDGLPTNRVNCVFQDKTGWLWVGTSGGLARYDGYTFKTYLLGNSSSEETLSMINCFFEDAHARLWIGTEDGGLALYNRSLDQFNYFVHNDTCTNCISSNLVHSIVSDASGIMWLATDNGLNRFDPGTNSFQWIQNNGSASQTLSSNTVQSLLIDRNNILWIGTSQGLDYYDTESGSITNLILDTEGDPALNNGLSVEYLYQDRKGNILVGTYQSGVFIIDPSTGRSNHIIPDPEFRRSYLVRAIYEDANGALWLGTRGGLYILDQSYRIMAHHVHNVQDRNTLGHNSINEIFEDRAGDLWISTRNGVSKASLGKMAFQYYGAGIGDKRYLNDPEVWSISESSDGRIWLGTESGGVNILDRQTGQFTYLTHDENNINSISSNCIKSILQDSDENFWLGTFLEGLNYYNAKQHKFIHYVNDPLNENSLINNTVWALHQDRRSNIWIGTDGGLDRFDPVKKRFYHFRDSMKIQVVQVIFEDKAGNLFFGSGHEGFTLLTPSSHMINFDIPARVFFEDSKGRIWIGSDINTGLKQFDILKGVVKSYTTEDNLPSNQVYGILEDEDSKLWLSTGQGLSMFDPEKEIFTNYKTEDGIQGASFYYGSYCISNSGELIFGGQNGVTMFSPDELLENQYIPPVVITDFKIFNKPVPVGTEFDGRKILEKSLSESKEIILSYKHSVLTFDFVALNYVNSSKNEYAHMLEGFETEWNYVGTNRSATYTNLDPGKYTFRVKAANNDGVWNEKGTSLDIVVTPPFWKTAVFKILIIFTLALIVFLIITYIVKREKLKNELVLERIKSKELRKIDMMKFQFFTNISHEIRTPISLILSPLTRIMNSDLSREQIKSDLDVVYRNATRLGKLIDQLLDFRKIEAGKLKLELSKGDIVSFLKKVIYLFKELSTEKRVNLEFYSVLDQIEMYFDPDKVEKVLFNLLSNAFKHTPEGGTIRVAVSLTYQMDQDHSENGNVVTGEYVQIVVKDTGDGIPESKRERVFERFFQENTSGGNINSGSGIGLSLSRELIKIHNGSILLKSQEGIGTELTILLPVIKEENDKPEKKEVQKIDLLHQVEPADKKVQINEILTENGKPILLVLEDNRELLEFITSIFEEDFNVLCAEDGEEGLRLANETIPDIIISDILMPKMDGKKFCSAIKEDFKTSHIPVVLLTALSSRQHEKEGILVGADEYIVKPFDPSLLKIKVDQLLSTRRLLREKYNRENILNPVENSVTSPDDKFLQKLICIIEGNISDPTFGTVKISREIGVSRTQLYRKMAALTDMTVKEFVRSVRLKRACQLILQQEMNISEAAFSAGFQQVAHFRKCFKEEYKMTPSAYIRKNSISYDKTV